MALISQILSIFGSGLGSAFAWLVSWWQERKAAQGAALEQMKQDIVDHSQDGKISVGEADSAQSQLSDIDLQLSELDRAQQIKPIKEKP